MSNSEKLDIVDVKKNCHMSFEDGGQSNYEAKIHYPNHIHHGRKIILITWTPKLGFMEYGKTETYYKCDLFPDKEYKTLNGLLKKMGLPKYEPPKRVSIPANSFIDDKMTFILHSVNTKRLK